MTHRIATEKGVSLSQETKNGPRLYRLVFFFQAVSTEDSACLAAHGTPSVRAILITGMKG